ncbi:hypothetical protein EYS10_12690 [Rahnella aquatilis]|nr:hypothetical protein EYS10_12690 [Rahnella aquatilis]
MKRMKDSLKTSCITGLQKVTLPLGGVLLCAALSGSASAASDTAPLTLTYTVSEGTCTVDVPSPVDFGIVSASGETRDALNASWFFIGIRSFDIKLSSCAGTGLTTAKTPAVFVQGFAPAAGSASPDKQKYIMMPTTVETPPTGLGMVISQSGKTLTHGSVTTLSEIVAGKMYIDTGPTGTAPSATGATTLRLQVALACGALTDCTVANLNPGSESMTLTFSFGYR